MSERVAFRRNIGLLFRHPRLHAILPVIMLVLLFMAIVFVFNEPAPLIPAR